MKKAGSTPGHWYLDKDNYLFITDRIKVC